MAIAKSVLLRITHMQKLKRSKWGIWDELSIIFFLTLHCNLCIDLVRAYVCVCVERKNNVLAPKRYNVPPTNCKHYFWFLLPTSEMCYANFELQDCKLQEKSNQTTQAFKEMNMLAMATQSYENVHDMLC